MKFYMNEDIIAETVTLSEAEMVINSYFEKGWYLGHINVNDEIYYRDFEKVLVAKGNEANVYFYDLASYKQILTAQLMSLIVRVQGTSETITKLVYSNFELDSKVGLALSNDLIEIVELLSHKELGEYSHAVNKLYSIFNHCIDHQNSKDYFNLVDEINYSLIPLLETLSTTEELS